MADTSLSFIDPVFLARFGLSRANAIDYFLHPLNPFRRNVSSGTTSSNEVLAMQGISLDTLLQTQIQQQHLQGRPYDPISALSRAEYDYSRHLEKLVGEQYELVPKDEERNQVNANIGEQASPPAPDQLFVIRHVLRSSRTTRKVLGIYYIIEGAIYKSPSVRSIVKANLSRTIEALTDTCQVLSECAQYEPTLGFMWNFDKDESDMNSRKKLSLRKRPRTATDYNAQSEDEEERLKASEAIDNILIRLNRKVTMQSSLRPEADRRK